MPTGIITRIVADQYTVRTDQGSVVCAARGRLRLLDTPPAVGDEVVISLLEDGSGRIDEILPRRNYMERPTVANVDQVIGVVAFGEPPINWLLLDKILVTAESMGLDSVVVYNKSDMGMSSDLMVPYQKAGYTVLAVSAKFCDGLDQLRTVCKDKISVMAGQSGVGKSSLLNALVPDVELPTQSISKKRRAGRHTTREVQLIELPTGGLIADTPGFNRLDLAEVESETLADLFPEMALLVGECRFGVSCLHHKEPGCAVKAACEQGLIDEGRYQRYLMILQELQERERMKYR